MNLVYRAVNLFGPLLSHLLPFYHRLHQATLIPPSDIFRLTAIATDQKFNL